MKTIILLVSLFVGLQLSYTAQGQGDGTKTKTTKKAPKTTAVTDTKSGNVYVCNSKTVKTYHCKKDCGLLKKCKSEIKEYSKADAEAKGLAACKTCCKAPKGN